ncbi:hypothetical protein NDI45_17085 [Leptolyngbya sp. GB1-A1]|uniref:hypothetical protein n=1 Tax=Leptolyngbya sp. GB1-A1 TaxID=2933908 RepID=UPI0032993073
MLCSLSTKLFSLTVLILLGSTLIGNSKAALRLEPSVSPQVTQPTVLPSATPELSDHRNPCNAYFNQQCLTP